MNINEECLGERRSAENGRDLFYISKKALPIANHIMRNDSDISKDTKVFL
jgi:hypothetical protein